MKSTLSIIIVLISILYSCKKEIVGPKGDTGNIGNTGLQGNAGLSNQLVFFGRVTFPMWASSSGTIDGNYLYTNSYVLFSSYSNDQPKYNLDSSTVIMYIDLDTSSAREWVPLPYSENGDTFSFSISNWSNLVQYYPKLLLTKYDGSMPGLPTRNFDLKMIIVTK